LKNLKSISKLALASEWNDHQPRQSCNKI